jgi:hypothetical protein
MTILSNLRPLEIFYVHSVYFVVVWCTYFPPFWHFGPRKISQPWFGCAFESFQINWKIPCLNMYICIVNSLLKPGLPDGNFSNPKKTILDKFWRVSKWKMLVYFMVICNILCTAIRCILWPLDNVVVIWYIFPRFGILCQEKSGNPGWSRYGSVKFKTSDCKTACRVDCSL